MAPSSSASYGEGKGKTIVIVVDDEDETILADDRGKTLLGKNTMITSTAASDMTKGKGLTKDPTKGMTKDMATTMTTSSAVPTEGMRSAKSMGKGPWQTARAALQHDDEHDGPIPYPLYSEDGWRVPDYHVVTAWSPNMKNRVRTSQSPALLPYADRYTQYERKIAYVDGGEVIYGPIR